VDAFLSLVLILANDRRMPWRIPFDSTGTKGRISDAIRDTIVIPRITIWRTLVAWSSVVLILYSTKNIKIS